MSAPVDVRGVIRATIEQLRATGDTGLVENLLDADAAVAKLIIASAGVSGTLFRWRVTGISPTYSDWMDLERRIDEALVRVGGAK